jgi:hypothetical protein
MGLVPCWVQAATVTAALLGSKGVAVIVAKRVIGVPVAQCVSERRCRGLRPRFEFSRDAQTPNKSNCQHHRDAVSSGSCRDISIAAASCFAPRWYANVRLNVLKIFY